MVTDYEIALEMETNYIEQNVRRLIINYHLINGAISDDINESIKGENINKIIDKSMNIITDFDEYIMLIEMANVNTMKMIIMKTVIMTIYDMKLL